MQQINLSEVTKIIAEMEARYQEDEIKTRDAESTAQSLRTHLNHQRKIIDAWKLHATSLKEIGEFH